METTSNSIIETTFNKCCDDIKKLEQSPSDNDLLELYSYYKQATVGDCDTKQPSAFNIKAKKKWDAWDSLLGMEKEEAMNNYIELANSLLSKQ